MFLQYELLSQADPYLSGEVRPIQDRVNYESSNELISKISQLKESIKNLNSLEIKLKVQKISLFNHVLFGNNSDVSSIPADVYSLC